MEDVEIFYFNGKLKNKITSKIYKKNTVLTFKRSIKLVSANSHVKTKLILSSTKQLIKNIPESLTNSVIRPWPTDPGSKLKIISFLESILLFGFLIYAIWNRRKLNENEKLIVFGLITFACLLFLLIGWTTPVLGAVARYRFPAQLALFIVGFILLQSSKFKLWKCTSS
jgi:hypothetical protein